MRLWSPNSWASELNSIPTMGLWNWLTASQQGTSGTPKGSQRGGLRNWQTHWCFNLESLELKMSKIGVFRTTDKFSNFTYQDKLTRSNTRYNTDLIAKLRKQAIKSSKNLYLSSSKCWYGGMMDWKFWYNIEFWCLYCTQNVLKQCIF